MKSRLKLGHKRGGRGQSLRPRSSRNRGVIPKKGTSVYLSLLLPHEHISEATASPAPRTAIAGHIHCCHSGLLMSGQDSFQTLHSFTVGMLLCQLLLYLHRVTTSSWEKCRCHVAVSPGLWEEHARKLDEDSNLLTCSWTMCHLLLKQVIKQGLPLPHQTWEGEACYCYKIVKKWSEITFTLLYQSQLHTYLDENYKNTCVDESAVYPCGQEGQRYPRVHQKCGQQVEGADPAPLFSPREAISGEECYGQFSLHSSSKKRSYWRGVQQRPQWWTWGLEHHLWGETVGAGPLGQRRKGWEGISFLHTSI